MILSLIQRPLFRVMKLLCETSVDEDAPDATIVSGGAWPFILAGGCRSAMMVCWCLAGTAIAFRILSLSCTAAAVAGMFWRNSNPLLFFFCFLFFLIVVALDFALFTVLCVG